jgi:hypothetical protein
MAAKKLRRGAISLALTLALALFGAAGKPSGTGVLVICVAVAIALCYGLSSWASRSTLSVAEKIGRAILIVAVSFSASAVYGWLFWPAPVSQIPAVTISPVTVSFKSEFANENYIFTLRSHSDNDLYEVQFKFRIESNSLKASDFSLEIPAGSRPPIIEGSVFSDISGVLCEDIKSRPVMLMSVYRLRPHESREISLTRIAAGTAVVSCEVSHFTPQPQPRIAEPGKVTETFYPGETLTCGAALRVAAPSVRSVQLDAMVRQTFIEKLRGQSSSRERIRIGCANSNEEACVVAAQFLDLFREAGWKVEGNAVQRLVLPKPLSGVALFKHGTGVADPSNPHSGLWIEQTKSLLTVESAFTKVGIETTQHADASMPEGLVGIYFGVQH